MSKTNTPSPARKALCDLAVTDLPAGGHTARLHAALTEAIQQLEDLEHLAPHREPYQLGSLAYRGLNAVAEKLRA